MSNSNQMIEFAKARIALKYGLLLIKASPGSVVLVPDYLCSVLRHPLIQLGLQVSTYPILDNLSPDWAELEKIQQRLSAWALFMVHYFGQPQNTDDFRRFCDQYQLKLIEDNAQGHGGKHHGQLLGTFGDIGISSPRKILNISSGGCLYIDSESATVAKAAQGALPAAAESTADFLKSVVWRSAILRNWLRALPGINREWSDPYLFQEPEQADFQINPSVSDSIRLAQWDHLADLRRSAWRSWQVFCLENDLEPVFRAVYEGSCPWAFPVYARDSAHRNRWLNWGARHGVPLFTWPALPSDEIESEGSAYSRWKRLLCFPLDVLPIKVQGVRIGL